jgi:hypothetical protein
MRRAATLVLLAGLMLPLAAAPTRPAPKKLEVAPGVLVFMTAPYGGVGLDGNSIVVRSREGVLVFDSNGTPDAARSAARVRRTWRSVVTFVCRRTGSATISSKDCAPPGST